MSRGRGAVVAGVAVLVLIAVAIVLLSEPAPVPFDVGSSAPDGYRALRILLEDRGIEVGSARADGVIEDPPEADEAIVVPVWEYLDDAQRLELEDLAASGRLLVRSGTDFFLPEDNSLLAHSGAVVVPRGYCDIPSLEDLTEVDDISGGHLVPAAGQRVCFGDATAASVVEEPLGDGSVVELSSPYLWANARLQPDKEEGGAALDNGPMAVALLSGVGSVTFVEAVPTAGVTPDGTRNPIELLPLGVKLLLAQGVGAFVIYAWWRGRRLGRPVREEMPVEVAGSELVEAVGGLLRRAGSPARAADVVRADTRRTLGARLGVPPDAGTEGLIGPVAARTGRDPAEVAASLFYGPVGSTADLVRLIRSLDTLRTEVLDGQPVA